MLKLCSTMFHKKEEGTWNKSVNRPGHYTGRLNNKLILVFGQKEEGALFHVHCGRIGRKKHVWQKKAGLFPGDVWFDSLFAYSKKEASAQTIGSMGITELAMTLLEEQNEKWTLRLDRGPYQMIPSNFRAMVWVSASCMSQKLESVEENWWSKAWNMVCVDPKIAPEFDHKLSKGFRCKWKISLTVQ